MRAVHCTVRVQVVGVMMHVVCCSGGAVLWVYCRGLRLSGGVVTRMRGATSNMLALCSAGIMTWESYVG